MNTEDATDFNVTLKKTVHYTGSVQITGHGEHRRAMLTPVDHPDAYEVVNGKLAMTGTVMEWDESTGVLVTKRTIYVPLKEYAKSCVDHFAEPSEGSA